jgi:hypothetical protein
MRKRVGWVTALGLITLGILGITQGLSASASPSSQVPNEEATAPNEEAPVPPAGAQVTSSQLASVRSTALALSAKSGDYAPTLSVAEKTEPYGQALTTIAPTAVPPELIDPRTGVSWAQSSVYVVTMKGHFTIVRHVPPNKQIPTGTQLSLAIDVATGRIVSTILSNEPVNLPAPVTVAP